MTAQDPYPGIHFDEALNALLTRFPDGDIRRESNGNVFISLPLSDGGSFRAALTWQQAKYLAYSTLTGDDLRYGRLPTDWPPDC